MALVTVEVADLAAASRDLVRTVADPLFDGVRTALRGVQTGGGMAGDDPGGVNWSSSYDDAAPAAITAAEDVINACYRVSTMLGASARNYAHAELASTTHSHAGDSSLTSALAGVPTDAQIVLQSSVPSASSGAGSGNTPTGWHFIAHHLGGYVWPNGHQDRLRAVARAWHASARVLDDHAFNLVLVDLGPLRDRLPEGEHIATVCNALYEHVQDVARAHRGLGEACSQLAAHIDHAHSRVEHELAELVAWTAGIQAAGAVASIFTFGAAEAPAQAAQAARIASTVSAVVGILRDFVAAVKTLLAAIAPIADAMASARAALSWLKDLRIVQVEVAGVPGMRAYQVARVERAGRQAAATTEVAAGEGAAVEGLADEVSAAANSYHWAREETLADHYARHGADFGSTSVEDYARKAREFFRTRGEGRIEVKIDETDGTIRIYDEATNTFGVYTPNGMTRTFYKPKDERAYWLRQPGELK